VIAPHGRKDKPALVASAELCGESLPARVVAAALETADYSAVGIDGDDVRLVLGA
jgi:hypothetical protein